MKKHSGYKIFKQKQGMVSSGRCYKCLTDWRVSRGVPFSITLKSFLWQGYSPATLFLALSDGVHFHSSWNPAACNIAKRTATSCFLCIFSSNQRKCFFSVFLIIHIYNDNTIVSVIRVIETHTQKELIARFFYKQCQAEIEKNKQKLSMQKLSKR